MFVNIVFYPSASLLYCYIGHIEKFLYDMTACENLITNMLYFWHKYIPYYLNNFTY